MTENAKRETGRKAQMSNIRAARAIADIVKTTLGPKSMLKMLLDPMGGIVMTNDGNAILREVDVSHPAAKSMIEISRAQDEEVGDGTTSVIILAGEILSSAEPFIQKNVHPTVIVGALFKALEEAQKIVENNSIPIDIHDDKQMMKIIHSCIGTKFASRWGDLISDLALKAVRTVMVETGAGKFDIDTKKYAKVEKIPGGTLEECRVLDGCMFNKDITHPKMRRRIENPRVILLDCPLEYKKGESKTDMEMSDANDFELALKMEEEEVERLCNAILKFKPDVVITEKGVSDLAQHYLLKGNVSAIRRIRKTDNNRVARISGAVIVNRPEELQESDVGTRCGLFEVNKIGDDYFTFMTKCKDPKACTILLRGASKDVLNEMERNFQDCTAVARNVAMNPRLVPGGGAAEMEISARLMEMAKTIEGEAQLPFKTLAGAFEIIPRILCQNCGVDVVRIITELRAKHSSEDGKFFGINGESGKVESMEACDVWDPLSVKLQTIKTAAQCASMLLRIDDIVSGIQKKQPQRAPATDQGEPQETFGDQRDG